TCQRGIVLGAQLKSQQLVVRTRVGVLFESICYFEKPHRGWRLRGGSRGKRKRGITGSLAGRHHRLLLREEYERIQRRCILWVARQILDPFPRSGVRRRFTCRGR